MGLLSTLFGRTEVRKPNREQFFAIVTSAIELADREELRLTEHAGVVFNPVESSFFNEFDRELRDLLKINERATGTRFEIVDDGYGTRWVVLGDLDFEDLVTTIHLVGETLTEHGFGDRLVAAVFRFDYEGKKAYWIYNIKRGTFYPFVLASERDRDNAAEMRLGALMEEARIPVELELEQWYALWGIPF